VRRLGRRSLLDGASLDAMAQAVRKSRAELSSRSQRIIGRLRPALKARPVRGGAAGSE
jgi:hypothetical protein